MCSKEDTNSIINLVNKLIEDVRKNELEIQQLKSENIDLKKKIEESQKEREQMRIQILQLQPNHKISIQEKINFASLVENSLKEVNKSLEEFNSHTIHSQQITISNIISKSPNSVSNQQLSIFRNLLKFFDIYSLSNNSNYFVTIEAKNSKKYIKLHNYSIQILNDNKQLLSYNFNNLIDHFDEIIIQLICQSNNNNNFDELYKNILRVKDFNTTKVYIDVFLKGFTQTGNKFQDNKSINYIQLDNSVKTISAKSFLGCSSLTQIIIPNSVTLIENNSFSNCA